MIPLPVCVFILCVRKNGTLFFEKQQPRARGEAAKGAGGGGGGRRRGGRHAAHTRSSTFLFFSLTESETDDCVTRV